MSRRTENSRTYLRPDGSLVAQLFAGPIQYRDAGGQWRLIDRRLELQSDGLLHNVFGPVDVTIPQHLEDAPVAVVHSGERAGIQLEGGSGPVASSGARARFAGVLPDTSLDYSVTPVGVKESLEVSGPTPPAVFRFALSLSTGLMPRVLKDGAVGLDDAAGRAVFVIPEPFMYDKGSPRDVRAVSMDLLNESGRWVLRLRPDASWLAAHASASTVVVDPSISLATSGAGQDCELHYPSSGSSCGAPYFDLGAWNGSGSDSRVLLAFAVQNTVPANAQVSDAVLETGNDNGGPGTVGVGVYALANQWDQTATWFQAGSTITDDGWNGGDFYPTAYVYGSGFDSNNNSLTYNTFNNVTPLAQAWVDHSIVDYGMLLKTTNGGLAAIDSSKSSNGVVGGVPPALVVTYSPRIGELANYSFDKYALTDKATLKVNRGDGNALIDSQDLSIKGTGLDLAISREYNSQSQAVGQYGRGMNSTIGPDQRLTFVTDVEGFNSVIFNDPSGAQVSFLWGFTCTPTSGCSSGSYCTNSGCTYITQSDYPATLTDNRPSVTGSPTQYTLTYRDGTRWIFGSDGYPTRVMDASGTALTLNYQGSPKQLSSIVDTQFRTVNFTYNADGTVHTMIDVTGRTWAYTDKTDGSHELTGYQDPAGAITQYGWDSAGRINQITSPEGRITKLTYASDYGVGQVQRVSNLTTGAADNTTYTRFVGGGSCATLVAGCYYYQTVTDPDNHATTYYYGNPGAWANTYPGGRVYWTQPPTGPRTRDYYSIAGQLTAHTVEGTPAATTNSVYDASDPFKLKSVTDATNAISSSSYGDAAHPTAPTLITDTQGNQLSYDYTSASSDTQIGLPNHVYDPNNFNRLLYTYDYNGNGTIHDVVDRSGNATNYGYDANGNLTSVTYSAGNPLGNTAIAPDNLSRVHVTQDGAGRTQTITYDADDRVLEIDYSDGTFVKYRYDRDGNQTQRIMSDSGTTVYAYDDKGRLTQQWLPGGQATTYGYDGADNLTSLTDGGGQVTYGYDAANRLTSITEPPASGNPQVTSLGYDSYGNQTTTQQPVGTTITRGYDLAGRMTSLALAPSGGGANQLQRVYDYTKPTGGIGDLLQSVTDETNHLTAYTYDTRDRLSEAKTTLSGTQTADYHYLYDDNGNIRQQTTSGVAANYSYNNANELSSDSTLTNYTYNGAGDLTATNLGLAYQYNGKGQTTNIQPMVGQPATSLTYAGPDQTQPTSQGSTTMLENTLGIAARTDATGTTYYTRDPSGGLIGERTPAGRYYYVLDRLDSVIGLTATGGVLANTYQYTPYGQTTTSTGVAPNAFGFESGLQAPGGLLQFGARFYNPSLGRWTQRDPVDQSRNSTEYDPYVFAGDDPVNQTDPSGRDFCEPIRAFRVPGGICILWKCWTSWFGKIIVYYKVTCGRNEREAVNSPGRRVCISR